MRAITVSRFGDADALALSQVPLPEPGPGDVRVKVHASAVDPIDVLIRNGALAEALPQRSLFVPGLEFSGEVDAVGVGVSGFDAGQPVVGLSPWFDTHAGAHAEYVVIPADCLVSAPRNVDPVAAATLPLNGIAATLALGLAAVRPSETLVVTGAAGGVGGYVVELAAAAGATVLAVAGPRDEETVRALGAAEFIARDSDLVAAVNALAPGGVDGVIDAASLGAAVLPALRDRGRFVAVLAHLAPEPERGIAVHTVQQAPDRQILADLVAKVESGDLTLRVAGSYPLEEAAAAHRRLEAGGVRGRLVLVP